MGKRKETFRLLNSRFDILTDLGKGGNGKVSIAIDKHTGEKNAVKRLINGSKKKRHRFLDEIRIVEKYCDSICGIIPIFESCSEEYWYTMPIAKTITTHIKETKSSAMDIAQGIVQLAETLNQLHNNDVSHRDIKPGNILFYEGRYCLSDFGLASFPDNPDDLTRSDRGLGAIFTIAPEMKRDPKHSDGKKADVFSLAKTTWMLLTGNNRGFDGVYNPFDPSHSLRYIDHLSDVHLVELEHLLTLSTNNDPELRPSMGDFCSSMIEWLEISTDANRSQASEWNFINQYLFGDNTPELAVWRDRDAIIRVLNFVGRVRAFNHMLFSDKGGNDFKSAEYTTENGCICITDANNFHYIVKPEFLCLETFGQDYEWSYFLLQLSSLEPILKDEVCGQAEYLVEDTPGNYVSSRDSIYGVYDYETGEILPEGYRTVIRYLTGSFLIVLKESPYNSIPATYDGRHGRCDRETFRRYMDSLNIKYHKLMSCGLSEYDALCLIGKNPFGDVEENTPELSRQDNPPFEYILETFLSWYFPNLVLTTETTNISFFFSFQLMNGGSICDIIEHQGYYLCSDGRIRKNPPNKLIYRVYDRETANKIKEELNCIIAQLCKREGYDVPGKHGAHFDICLQRSGKPVHLFTKQEIEALMRSADDRNLNMLVIDENGKAVIIQDTYLGLLYPVRHEAWEPRNNYVGKYSDVSTLDDTYLASLQGWLYYLESGYHQNMDSTHSERDIEHLIEQIKKYY